MSGMLPMLRAWHKTATGQEMTDPYQNPSHQRVYQGQGGGIRTMTISKHCASKYYCFHEAEVHFKDESHRPSLIWLSGMNIAQLYALHGRRLDDPHFTEHVEKIRKRGWILQPPPPPPPPLPEPEDLECAENGGGVCENTRPKDESPRPIKRCKLTICDDADSGNNDHMIEQPWDWEWDDVGDL